jgi:hypothetical protein
VTIMTRTRMGGVSLLLTLIGGCSRCQSAAEQGALVDAATIAEASAPSPLPALCPSIPPPGRLPR